MGGLLAMVLAVAMPTVVAGAVLNDVGPTINYGALDAILDRLRDDPPMSDWETAAARLRDQMPGFPGRTDDEWMTTALRTYRQCEDGLVLRRSPVPVRYGNRCPAPQICRAAAGDESKRQWLFEPVRSGIAPAFSHVLNG